jgi:hypothetical protein
MIISDELAPHLQKQVDIGLSGTDILHGELKNLMYETEQALAEYVDPDNEEYDQTVDRLHLEGFLDALTHIYQLTYNLSFAINDRSKSNG